MRIMLIILFAVTIKATGYVRATIIAPTQEQPPSVVYTAEGPTAQVVY